MRRAAAIACIIWAAPALAGTPLELRPAAAPAPEEEIVIEGRRGAAPTFQEEFEFHRSELDRLRRRFEPVRPGHDRMEGMTATPDPDAGKSVIPSPGSAIVQGRPTQR